MNRGIMVTICDPDERELIETARYLAIAIYKHSSL